MWWERWKQNGNLQGGENKKHSEVDLDNQVGELVSKHLSNEAVGFLALIDQNCGKKHLLW